LPIAAQATESSSSSASRPVASFCMQRPAREWRIPDGASGIS
jgi:hypothetical protein